MQHLDLAVAGVDPAQLEDGREQGRSNSAIGTSPARTARPDADVAASSGSSAAPR